MRNSLSLSAQGILLSACISLLFFLRASLAEPPENSRDVLPCPIDADLWVLAGQSNMEGYGRGKMLIAEERRILLFDMENHWRVATEPLHDIYNAAAPVHKRLYLSQAQGPEGKKELAANWEKLKEQDRKTPLSGIGPGLFFARHVLEYTGRPIGLIPCARGNTSMADWRPALRDQGDDSLYGMMLGRIRRVGKNIKGILWYQGENDTVGDSRNFERNFLELVDAIRRDTKQPELPIIYVQIGRDALQDQSAKGWEHIREAQRRVARQRKNLFMTTGIDQPMDDFVHLSTAGQRCLGRRLGEIALSCVYGMPGHGRPVDLESIKIVNRPEPESSVMIRTTIVRLHFSGVSGRLHAAGPPGQFELRGNPSRFAAMFRVNFVPEDPAGLDLHISTDLTQPAQVVGGPGANPIMNIVDDKDMPVPAFGPVAIPFY